MSPNDEGLRFGAEEFGHEPVDKRWRWLLVLGALSSLAPGPILRPPPSLQGACCPQGVGLCLQEKVFCQASASESVCGGPQLKGKETKPGFGPYRAPGSSLGPGFLLNNVFLMELICCYFWNLRVCDPYRLSPWSSVRICVPCITYKFSCTAFRVFPSFFPARTFDDSSL